MAFRHFDEEFDVKTTEKGSAEILPSAQPRAGYGACSVSGCHCKSFNPDSFSVCITCGHSESEHW
jgi:hypothetical protein